MHIVKDETEKLREYYQEKSLGMPQSCHADHSYHLLGMHQPSLSNIICSPLQPITSRPHSESSAVNALQACTFARAAQAVSTKEAQACVKFHLP